MPEELVGSHADSSSLNTSVVRADDANVAEDSSSSVTLSNPPLRARYD